jgi:hypothetical protein
VMFPQVKARQKLPLLTKTGTSSSFVLSIRIHLPCTPAAPASAETRAKNAGKYCDNRRQRSALWVGSGPWGEEASPTSFKKPGRYKKIIRCPCSAAHVVLSTKGMSAVIFEGNLYCSATCVPFLLASLVSFLMQRAKW